MRRLEGLIIIFLLFVLFVSLFAFVSIPSQLSDLDSADYGDLSGVPDLSVYAESDKWLVVGCLGYDNFVPYYAKQNLVSGVWSDWIALSGAGFEVMSLAVVGDNLTYTVRGTDNTLYCTVVDLTDDSVLVAWYGVGDSGVQRYLRWSELHGVPDFSGYGSYDNLTGVPVVDLEHGLCLWLPFDGVALDKSGYRYDGSASSVTYGYGRFFKACEFVGASNSVVDVSSVLSVLSPVQGCVSFWVNVSSGNSNYDDYIGNAGGSGVRFFVGYYNSRVYYRLGDLGTSLGDTVFTVGTYYHVVLNWWSVGSTRYCQLYVNGVVDDEEQSGFAFSGFAPSLNVGCGTVGNYHFDGAIDDLRFYTRSLSVYEIEALYGLGV